MKFRARAAICLVFLTALLAGCSGTSGTAAQVGDSTVSASDVAKLQAGCDKASEAAGIPIKASKYEMINWLVSGKIGQQIAKSTDVSVSESEQLDFLRAQNSAVQALMNEADCRAGLMEVAYFSQVMTKLQASGKQPNLPNLEVKVNPRFGQWDSRQNLIVENPGTLASPPESYFRQREEQMQAQQMQVQEMQQAPAGQEEVQEVPSEQK